MAVKVRGFEPLLREPKSLVLPLHHTSICKVPHHHDEAPVLCLTIAYGYASERIGGIEGANLAIPDDYEKVLIGAASLRYICFLLCFMEKAFGYRYRKARKDEKKI